MMIKTGCGADSASLRLDYDLDGNVLTNGVSGDLPKKRLTPAPCLPCFPPVLLA